MSAEADLRQSTFDDSSGAARVSSDVSLPTQMANGAFVVRLLFPPACATGTQPRPTRCEYLGCSRVGRADRTPSLRAGNLHRIPSTALPHSRRCFPTAPTAEPAAPPTHKVRLLADATSDPWLGTKTCRPQDRCARLTAGPGWTPPQRVLRRPPTTSLRTGCKLHCPTVLRSTRFCA